MRSFGARTITLLLIGTGNVVSGGRAVSARQIDSPEKHLRTGMLQPFTYADVAINGGPMGIQAAGARAFYLALSEDNLLNGFRKRAGLPAPGVPMGGWYDPEGFAGAHPFGQYISALARMFANTGDLRFKQKVARLVHGFNLTIAPDGFFYSSQKVFREWPNYLYDKNCTGMRDAYTLTGNAEALVVLKRMTDWAVKTLPRRRDEWYTLPENLYNCYALTHDSRYLTMAKEYDYSTDFYNKFAAGVNAFSPNLHAYSHINTLSSAAKAYEATGDERYFNALQSAWQFLTTTQMYASGGWGPRERFVAAGSGGLADSIDSIHNHFETPCGAYANANLDRYMLRFTGATKYGDNMERVLLNGMLATLPMQPDGRTFYYSDYQSGTSKAYFGSAWPCCSGTYAEITADYPLDIYFHDAQGLYVNLFAASTVRWRSGSRQVEVHQATLYPESNRILLTVRLCAPSRFALHVRVPGWVAGRPTVLLNGRPWTGTAAAGTFLAVTRTWRNGDTLDVTLPMALRFEAVAPESPTRAALMYGPVMLVALANGPVPLTAQQMRIMRTPTTGSATAQSFETADGKVLFMPFYLVGNQRYTTYLTVPDMRGVLRVKGAPPVWPDAGEPTGAFHASTFIHHPS